MAEPDRDLAYAKKRRDAAAAQYLSEIGVEIPQPLAGTGWDLAAQKRRNGGLTDFQVGLLRSFEEKEAIDAGAAQLAWQTMYDLCGNSGQQAILEVLRGEFMTLHGEGNWAVGGDGGYNPETFIKYWAGRVNSLSGGTDIPQISYDPEGNTADEQDAYAYESGGDPEADESTEYENAVAEGGAYE